MSILYQTETERSVRNFPFSYQTVAKELIYAIVEVKKAAAVANFKDKGISQEISEAITQACDTILTGKHDDQFVTCALQGGAGTSINMNVNEVIATLATQTLTSKGSATVVHPLDHVNKSQSTNDVNPSGLKIACYRLIETLQTSLEEAVKIFEQKSQEWASIPKLARTHLQDAIPTMVGAEFGSYASTLKRHLHHLADIKPYFLELNLSGTAIGDQTNASKNYEEAVYQELFHITKLPVKPLENLMSGTSSQTDFVSLSSTIVALFVDCSKIASDIRLLSSGPRGGLGELVLPELQKGSSIMPGKVNPVMCEVVNQTYFLLSGYNLTIQRAAEASQLELGVMFPILADTLISSLILSHQVLEAFTTLISKTTINEINCRKHLEQSTAYATVLTPMLGYDAVSAIVKESISKGMTIVDILKEKNLYTDSVQEVLGKQVK